MTQLDVLLDLTLDGEHNMDGESATFKLLGKHTAEKLYNIRTTELDLIIKLIAMVDQPSSTKEIKDKFMDSLGVGLKERVEARIRKQQADAQQQKVPVNLQLGDKCIVNNEGSPDHGKTVIVREYSDGMATVDINDGRGNKSTLYVYGNQLIKMHPNGELHQMNVANPVQSRPEKSHIQNLARRETDHIEYMRENPEPQKRRRRRFSASSLPSVPRSKPLSSEPNVSAAPTVSDINGSVSDSPEWLQAPERPKQLPVQIPNGYDAESQYYPPNIQEQNVHRRQIESHRKSNSIHSNVPAHTGLEKGAFAIILNKGYEVQVVSDLRDNQVQIQYQKEGGTGKTEWINISDLIPRIWNDAYKQSIGSPGQQYYTPY